MGVPKINCGGLNRTCEVRAGGAKALSVVSVDAGLAEGQACPYRSSLHLWGGLPHYWSSDEVMGGAWPFLGVDRRFSDVFQPFCLLLILNSGV